MFDCFDFLMLFYVVFLIVWFLCVFLWTVWFVRICRVASCVLSWLFVFFRDVLRFSVIVWVCLFVDFVGFVLCFIIYYVFMCFVTFYFFCDFQCFVLFVFIICHDWSWFLIMLRDLPCFCMNFSVCPLYVMFNAYRMRIYRAGGRGVSGAGYREGAKFMLKPY